MEINDKTLTLRFLAIIRGNISNPIYIQDISKNDENKIIAKINLYVKYSFEMNVYASQPTKHKKYVTNLISWISIKNVELEYMLDSKGYYVPIYNFAASINGSGKGNIRIKAIK